MRVSRRPPRTRLAPTLHTSPHSFLVATRELTPVGGRGALQIRAGTISTNDFKVGVNVEVDNARGR